MSERLKFLSEDPSFQFASKADKARRLSEEVVEYGDLNPQEQYELVDELDRRKPLVDKRSGLGFGARARLSFAKNDIDGLETLQKDFGENNAVLTDDGLAFRNNADDKWKLVDETRGGLFGGSITFRDFADMVGEAPEIIGGTIGSVVGTLGGGIASLGLGSLGGGIAGASAGAAAGETISQGIGHLLGVEQPEGLEAAGEIALAGGLGATAELGGHVLAKTAARGLGKLISPLKSKVNPDINDAVRGLRDQFPDWDVQLTPAMMFESQLVDLAEQWSASGLFGGRILQRQVKAFDALDELSSHLAARLSRNTVLKTADMDSSTVLGQKIIDIADGTWQPTNFIKATVEKKEIVEEATNLGLEIPLSTIAKKDPETVTAALSRLAIKPRINSKGREYVDIKEAFNLRSELRNLKDIDYRAMAQQGGAANRIRYKESKALHESFKGSIKNVFVKNKAKDANGKSLARKMAFSDEQFSKYYQQYTSNFVKSIVAAGTDTLKPELVTSMILGEKALTRIQTIRKMLVGDSHWSKRAGKAGREFKLKNLPFDLGTKARDEALQTWRLLQTHALFDIINKAGKSSTIPGAKGVNRFISGKGLKDRLAKYDEDVLHELFGKQGTKDIESWATLLENLQTKVSQKDPGAVGMRLLQFGAVMNLGTGLIPGVGTPLRAASAMTLALPWGVAKMLTNPKAAGLLEHGFKIPIDKPRMFMATMNRLAAVGSSIEDKTLDYIKDVLYADVDAAQTNEMTKIKIPAGVASGMQLQIPESADFSGRLPATIGQRPEIPSYEEYMAQQKKVLGPNF